MSRQTTIVQTLQQTTGMFNRIFKKKSTVGIDMTEEVKLSDIDASVTVWDFAGQPQYTSTHHVIFLCTPYS